MALVALSCPPVDPANGVLVTQAPKADMCLHSSCSTHLQPCILFVGEKFESAPALKLARSLLLDIFRGEQVCVMSQVSCNENISCSKAWTGQTHANRS
jgi:hypothetical protein